MISVLSLSLIAILAIGGTLAYLTDTEQDVNVMTVGNVDVELLEQQRNAYGELEEFEDGKKMLPLVGSAQGAKDKWGLPDTSVTKNFVDKIVRAKNIGHFDAYVRIVIAIPLITYSDTQNTANASENVIHWNLGNRFDANGEGAWNTITPWNDPSIPYVQDFVNANATQGYVNEGVATIDGESYELYTFTYNGALEPGETTAAAMIGLYLDNRVDYSDVIDKYTITVDGKTYIIDYDFTKGVKIPVMVQAVQADGFKNAADAFTQAGMNASDGTFVNPWEDAVFASDLDELKAALSSASIGETVYMDADITVDGDIRVPTGVTLNGNGHKLVKASAHLSDYATVTDVVFDGSKTTASSNASHIYAGGPVTIDGCTFIDADWDAIQIAKATEDPRKTPAATAQKTDGTITINDCDFLSSANRYVHVEFNFFNADYKLVLTNNHFENLNAPAGNTIAGIYAQNITVGGNTYTGEDNTWVGVRDLTTYAWIQYGFDIFAGGYKFTWANPENAQAVIQAAAEGDTIVLTEGEYDTLIVMNANGSRKNDLTIRGSENAIVGCINLNSSQKVVLKDIIFDAAGAQLSYRRNGENYGIYGNIIGSRRDSDTSSAANPATNIVIDGCIFTGTAVDSSSYASLCFEERARSGGGNITVTNCTFDAEAIYCVRGYYVGPGGQWVFEGNTFNNCIGNVLAFGTCQSNLIIKNNVFNGWNQNSCAIFTSRNGSHAMEFTVTGNTFNFVDDGDTTTNPIIFAVKGSNWNLTFEDNTFAGSFAGMDETTVPCQKP